MITRVRLGDKDPQIGGSPMMPTAILRTTLPLWITAPLVFGAFVGLWRWERRSPLRRTVESRSRRTERNLAMAALAAASLQVTEHPVIQRLSLAVEERQWGLLNVRCLPSWVELPLAVLLLDYTLYVWHVLLHRVTWLWRSHVVH